MLLGDGRVGRSPGDVGAVRAGVARVAAARVHPPLEPEFEGVEPGSAAIGPRDHLVDRDACRDVRAHRLARVGAGQEARRRSGVVAGAVAEGVGVGVGEVAEDGEAVLHRLERRKGLGHAIQRSGPLGEPRGAVDAVGQEHEGESARRVAGCADRAETAWRHRLEPGQREGGAKAAEHGASRNRRGHEAFSAGGPARCRNCSEATIALTRSLRDGASMLRAMWSTVASSSPTRPRPRA